MARVIEIVPLNRRKLIGRMVGLLVGGPLSGAIIGSISYWKAFQGGMLDETDTMWLLKEGAIWGLIFGGIVFYITLWPMLFLNIPLFRTWIVLTLGAFAGMFINPVGIVGVDSRWENQPSIVGSLIAYIVTYIAYFSITLGKSVAPPKDVG